MRVASLLRQGTCLTLLVVAITNVSGALALHPAHLQRASPPPPPPTTASNPNLPSTDLVPTTSVAATTVSLPPPLSSVPHASRVHVLPAMSDAPSGPSHTPETEVTEHNFKPFEISAPHLVYVGFGAFVVIFACFSLFIKERLFLGEAPLAAIFGIIVGPYCLNLFNPSNWSAHQHDSKPPGDETTDTITLEVLRVTIALAVFAAGVELPKKYMIRHWQSITVLLGPVMLFGWLVTGLFLWGLVPGLDYLTSLVVAAAVTPTDPILSASVVGGPWAEKHVPAHIRHLLICESGCNDGAAFPFLYLAMYLTANRHDVGWAIGRWVYQILLYEIVLGTVIGALIGWIARKVIRLTEHWRLVDRESFVVHYIALALLSMGINALLGSDDLLAAFAAGAAFAWDGWFTRQTEDSNFSAIVDLLFNTATFIYLGAMMPFGAWVDPDTTLNIWRLFVVAILTILLKRIPIIVALWKYVPDIKTFQDALFVGHFGPMGCGAIFISTLGRTLLPEHTPHPPTHPNHYLANAMIPITYFLVLCSIAVHGLTVPFFSAARNSTKRLHQTLSQGGLGSTSLALSHTATWESWANRAFQRFKTTGSGKPSRHQTEDDDDDHHAADDEGGMAEIRRVLASQLNNQPRDPTEADVTETAASSYGAERDEKEGSGLVDPSGSPKDPTKETRFATTPTVDSQTGGNGVPLGQINGHPGINPMHNRTITFARHETYDDIEDTAADAEVDPGDGDWDMGENDAETRRIRQHTYLTGSSPYAAAMRSKRTDPSTGTGSERHPSDSLDTTRSTSKLKFVGRRIAGGAGSAVHRLGAVFRPDMSRRASGDTMPQPATHGGHGPISRIKELGEHDLEEQHTEEKHVEHEQQEQDERAEAMVERPSSNPEEEEGDGTWLRYPRVREWVEGSKLVLEYMASRLAEPQISVIDLTGDDEQSWEAERQTAHELDQPEPSPAWRWVCDHRAELETLVPELDPDHWTPHNARYELVKYQVPSQLAKKRKELRMDDSASHHSGWFASHVLSRHSSERRPSSKHATSPLATRSRSREDAHDVEEDDQSAAYRAQLAMAAQSGVGDGYEDDPLEATTSRYDPRPPSAEHMTPIESEQGTTDAEKEEAEGDLGLAQHVVSRSNDEPQNQHDQRTATAPHSSTTGRTDEEGIVVLPSTRTDPESPQKAKVFRVQNFQTRSPSP